MDQQPGAAGPSGQPSSQPGGMPPTNPTTGTGVPNVQPASVVQPSDAPLGVSELPMVHADAPVLPPPEPRKKPWMLVAIVVLVLALLGAAGYVFAYYLPNRPAALYSQGLENSGKAVDSLVNYSHAAAQKKHKSTDFTGNVQVKSSTASFDATVGGSYDKDANATAQISADVLGQQMVVDVRSKHVNSSATPDIFVRASGIKKALDQYGMGSFDSLDGQWIGIDHTLIDTYSSALGQDEANSALSASSVPTSDQLQDAVSKVQVVNKQYLFTTDSSKAVLTNQKYIGDETKDGRSAAHFKVGYNKAHLQDYVAALGTALDSSKLNDWSKSASGSKNLSSSLDIASLKKEVGKAKSNYTFDVWIDKKTKVVHSVRFTDPSDKNSVFTVAQNYTGGTTYPFQIGMTSKDSAGKTTSTALTVSVNTANDKVQGELKFDEKDTSGTITFALTPSDKSVEVVVPSGAMPLTSLLSQLFGADPFTTTTGTTSSLLSMESGL
ncbi:MAG TPA: hypothetical protein VLF59_01855 [Candidatus Saccharimonadales bacterium]|nr:hypothetical protein [Candidatus Saccharimonadales bacterium]